MKNKYERLSKEEKKQARQDYISFSEVNANIYKKLKRLIIISYIGIIYSVAMFIVDFIITKNVWDFVIDGVLMVFCVWFIIRSKTLISDSINKFLIENKK
jgi:hypothetical protein